MSRVFRDLAGLVVDDHQQVEVADHRIAPRAISDAGAPLCIVAALRGGARGPDVERAAIAVIALDIMLAKEFLVASPFGDGLLGIGQNLVAALAGWALEQDIFDDHGMVLRGIRTRLADRRDFA